MITQLTKDLIKEYGWIYLPEQDSLAGKDMMTPTILPESWTHERYGMVWDINEVLSLINDEIDLIFERDN